VRPTSTAFLQPQPYIELDDTYKLYVRKVRQQQDSEGKKLRTEPSFLQAENDSIIEVEYLLLSQADSNVIYFSTLPDKYQKFYAKHYLGDGYVNCWDFKTILFGRVDTTNRLAFTSVSGQHVDNWLIRQYNNDIFIESILESEHNIFEIQIPARYALEQPIKFNYIGNYQIVLHNPEKANDQDIIPLADRKIYYEPDGKKYRIYFQFKSETSEGFNNIYFPTKRIPYRPNLLRQ
jgi:hypothetical protein